MERLVESRARSAVSDAESQLRLVQKQIENHSNKRWTRFINWAGFTDDNGRKLRSDLEKGEQTLSEANLKHKSLQAIKGLTFTQTHKEPDEEHDWESHWMTTTIRGIYDERSIFITRSALVHSHLVFGDRIVEQTISGQDNKDRLSGEEAEALFTKLFQPLYDRAIAEKNLKS